AEIVSEDEREAGERALLNFGHTFGHAIEAAQGYGAWLHGEAVAAGMVIAARLSEKVCNLPMRDVERVIALVGACGLPIAPPKMPREHWVELMGHDKKVAEGGIRFVVLDSLGHASLRSGIAREQWEAALLG